MTDDRIKLTRRKILASTGAVGLAGAGAGLGTSAFFSDTETFENNTLTAGELDLKVDWEEHYSYPQLYGFDDPTMDGDNEPLDVVRSNPGDTSEYVGLPNPTNPMVWVAADDLDAYMDNTAIEAFPDPDGDGAQETEYDDWSYNPCEDGGDLDEDLTPGTGNATRTDRDYIEDGEPLINLRDVKPGDFGEFTLGFHLCDNPGYVWLQLSDFSESAGETTDPESELLEDGEIDDGELAENIQTVWWYDDGDNVYNPSPEDTLFLSDHSSADQASVYSVSPDVDGGTANTNHLLDTDFDAAHIAASTDGGEIYIVNEFGPEILVYDVITGDSADSTITIGDYGPLGEIVQAAVGPAGTLYLGSKTEDAIFEVNNPGSNNPTVSNRIDLDGVDIAGADNTFTTNDELYFYTNSDNKLYTINLVSGSISEVADLESGEDLTGLAVAESGTGDFVGSISEGTELIYFNDTGDIEHRLSLSGDLEEHTYGDLTTSDLKEDEFYTGSLADAASELEDGKLLNNDDCYQPGFTRYIGFAWWVPTDVGNEIQGDSVSFNLGFYTEQCRNNEDPELPEELSE